MTLRALGFMVSDPCGAYVRSQLLGHVQFFCDPMDCSPPGSSVHGILQASTVEWLAMPFFRDLPDPGIEPASLLSPELAGRFFTTSTTWNALIVIACFLFLYIDGLTT